MMSLLRLWVVRMVEGCGCAHPKVLAAWPVLGWCAHPPRLGGGGGHTPRRGRAPEAPWGASGAGYCVLRDRTDTSTPCLASASRRRRTEAGSHPSALAAPRTE